MYEKENAELREREQQFILKNLREIIIDIQKRIGDLEDKNDTSTESGKLRY